MSTNPKAVVMATVIAAAFPDVTVEREQNVITMEGADGERFIVTVETVFTASNDSLPDLDDFDPEDVAEDLDDDGDDDEITGVDGEGFDGGYGQGSYFQHAMRKD